MPMIFLYSFDSSLLLPKTSLPSVYLMFVCFLSSARYKGLPLFLSFFPMFIYLMNRTLLADVMFISSLSRFFSATYIQVNGRILHC